MLTRRTVANRLLFFLGPQFGSPAKPCELRVRNDQLVAGVLARQPLLDKVATSAGTVSMPVGTRHPAPGVHYQATRTCSDFPHIYDGIVYLYDCEDTLAWSGSVTIARATTS